MSRLILAIAAALLPLLGAAAGLTRALGAHPFWDVQTIAIGTCIGLPAGFALHAIGARPRMAPGLLLLTALAYAAATSGKARFAASFAEDHTAGLFWYYGWIATGAALSAAIALTVLSLPRPLREPPAA